MLILFFILTSVIVYNLFMLVRHGVLLDYKADLDQEYVSNWRDNEREVDIEEMVRFLRD